MTSLRIGPSVGAAGLGLFGVALVFACAEPGDDIGDPKLPSDAGTIHPSDAETPPTPDASVPPDAALPDAGPRECSKEGFCHTVVPPKQSLQGVWSDGAGTTWAVSAEGAILRYDGKAWTVHANVDDPLYAVWGSGPTDVWVGSEHGMFRGRGTSAATLTFDKVDLSGPDTPITSIWGTSANDIWATGGVNQYPLTGRVLHWAGDADDGGAGWTLEDASREAIWFAKVFGSAASGVWLAGTWNNPDTFQRDTIVLRRSAGATEFVQVALPRDPKMPDDPVGDLERVYDASASADGLSMWVLGRTHTGTPAYVSAKTSDGGQTFTWSFAETGFYYDPQMHAIGASTSNDAWMVGEYGRLQHWDGAKWKQSVITVDKFPVITPLYALGGHGADIWFVGDGIALHRDPSKIAP
jgi:hypothetical protein